MSNGTQFLICGVMGLVVWLIRLPHWRRMLVPFGRSDTLVQTIVAQEPTLFLRSIVLDYVNSVRAYANLIWLFPARYLGLSPVLVDALRTLVQNLIAAIAVGGLAMALDPEHPLWLIAVPLAFGSRFCKTGAPVQAILCEAAHNLTGMLLGVVILTFAILDKSPSWLFFFAGFLACYQPVHGFITLVNLLGVFILGKFENPGYNHMRLGLCWAVGVLPLVFLVLQPGRRQVALGRADACLNSDWWDLLRARTRNIFALAALDRRTGGGGWRSLTSPLALVYFNLAAGYVGAWLVLRSASVGAMDGTFAHTAQANLFVAAAVVTMVAAGSFLFQLVVSDWLRIPTLARAALYRAGVYMFPFTIVFWSALASRALDGSDGLGFAVAILCAVAITCPMRRDNSWVTAFSFFPLLGWLPRLGATITALNLSLVLLGLVAAYMTWWGRWGKSKYRPAEHTRAGRIQRIFRRRTGFWRLDKDDDFPALCLGVASGVALAHVYTGITIPLGAHAAFVGRIIIAALACRFLLDLSPFRATVAQEWEEVQVWARSHTEPGSLFAIPPELTGFEVFSHRPKFLDPLDVMFCVYVPALVPEVYRRCEALGVDPRTVPPVELLDRLIPAYRRVSRQTLDKLRDEFGVAYAIIEKGVWNEAAWDPQIICYINQAFVVVSTQTPADLRA